MTWKELNAEYLFEIRWWHRDEILSSDAVFAPADLARHLTDLLDRAIPTEPIDVGV
jgi:hypothetical protein